MILILLVIAILQFLLASKNLVWGLCFLISVRILIPDIARSPIPLFSVNSLNSILLFTCFIFKHNKYNKVGNKRIISSIIFYLGYLCLVLFLPKYTPFSYEIKYFLNFIVLHFLPIIVSIIVLNTKERLKLFLMFFFSSVLICVIYGLFCLTFGIDYPYNQFFTSLFPSQSDIDFTNNLEMGGVTGRIVGTAVADSWRYGMVITPIFFISYCLYKKMKSNIILFCLILCGISVLLTVRRSPIVSSMVFFFILAISQKHKFLFFTRFFKYAIFLLLFMFLVLYYVPALAEYRHIIEVSLFFWDDSVAAANEVSGSSFEYRIFQMSYTLRFIQDSFIWGNGWGSMYLKAHPAMNGWESMVFTSLAQVGILGSILFVKMLYEFYRYSITLSNTKRYAFAFIAANSFYFVLTDSYYLFYTLLGMVLLNKVDKFYVISTSEVM